MKALQISNILKWFGGRDVMRAVDQVSIEVEAGELLVLLGPSGCGKTTLLRCVAGLEEAQEGSISLGGHKVFDAAMRLNVPTHKRDIGMVFQNYSLWPHMSVQGNVEYPLRARRFGADERKNRAAEVLRILQCEHLAERLPAMLSGGQQQRVALARALASSPAIMLLDEPLSNLDALLREELRAQLRSIHRRLGFTGIYVTHDQTEAFTVGTRVAVMNTGRIEQLGTATEVHARPATEYIARFLGIRNSLEVTYDRQWSSPAGPIGGDLNLFGKESRALRLYARNQDVNLVVSGSLRTVPERCLTLSEGRVVEAIQVGNEVNYVVKVGEAAFYANRPANAAPFNVGDGVNIEIGHDDLLIYHEGNLLDVGPTANALG